MEANKYKSLILKKLIIENFLKNLLRVGIALFPPGLAVVIKVSIPPSLWVLLLTLIYLWMRRCSENKQKWFIFELSLDICTRIVIERALSFKRKSNRNGSRQNRYSEEFPKNEYRKVSKLVTDLRNISGLIFMKHFQSSWRSFKISSLIPLYCETTFHRSLSVTIFKVFIQMCILWLPLS